MVIVVGRALSVCLSGQLFTHLYHLLFPLHRFALSDWHVSFMVLFAMLVLCQFDFCRHFICVSNNWVSLSTKLNCQMTSHHITNIEPNHYF